MIGQAFAAGLEFAIPLVVIGFIVVVIVALVTARRDPDPTGSRPYAIYLVLVIFLAMFTALFGLTAVATNVVRIPLADQRTGCVSGPGFISCTSPSSSGSTSSGGGSGTVTPGPSPSGGGGSGPEGSTVPVPHPGPATYDPDRGYTSGAVLAGLIALVAFGVLWFHVRRLRELVSDPGFDVTPGRRTYQVYLHAVSFTAVAILIFASAAALYGIFRTAAPGYTSQLASHTSERDAGIAQLVSAGVLAVGAWIIFRYHWHRTTTLRGAGSPVRSDRGRSGPRHLGRTSAQAPAATPPPATPETPPSDEAPPPVIPPT
jgi:hypothetical protein